MSRKYLNDKWCIRCGRKTPCPYLKKNIKLLGGKTVVDIGCGNGRNAKYMQSLGYEVTAVDMAVNPEDVGDKSIDFIPMNLGRDIVPVHDGYADIILANYILMFLNEKERDYVLKDINRMSKEGTKLMVELYPAKDSEMKTVEECVAFKDGMIEKFMEYGWRVLRRSNDKFIMERNEE